MSDITVAENPFVPKEEEPKQINFATVAAVYDDGLTLIFDGEETPSEKHYQCNSFAVFRVGDRVRILEDSGTYVVEYPVGNPKKSFYADSAGTANTAKKADSTAKADSATTATSAGRLSAARTITITGAVTGSGNFDGGSNLSIGTRPAGDLEAATFNTRHVGSRLSFFSGAIASKQYVQTISSTSSATASTVATKVNQLINALKSYSLIG